MFPARKNPEYMVQGDFAAEKKMLRHEKLVLRRQMLPEERMRADSDIFSRLLCCSTYLAAHCVFCYASLPDEPDTSAVIADLLARGRMVCLPQIVDAGKGLMEAVSINSSTVLARDCYGILSPGFYQEDCVEPADIDCIIVPGVAFDRRLQRLGMGGGFYDRFFARAPQAARLALAYGCQLAQSVPIEQHDFAMTAVITDKSILQSGSWLLDNEFEEDISS